MICCFGCSERVAVSSYFNYPLHSVVRVRCAITHHRGAVCAFWITIGASASYMRIIFMFISTSRGNDSARHQTFLLYPPSFFSGTVDSPRVRHHLHLLATIIVPRHPQTLRRVQLRALWDVRHHNLRCERRPIHIFTLKR